MPRIAKSPKSNFIIVSVKMPKALVEELDRLVKEDWYTSRTDAVREAVRRLVLVHQEIRRNQLEPLSPAYR